MTPCKINNYISETIYIGAACELFLIQQLSIHHLPRQECTVQYSTGPLYLTLCALCISKLIVHLYNVQYVKGILVIHTLKSILCNCKVISVLKKSKAVSDTAIMLFIDICYKTKKLYCLKLKQKL